MIDLNDPIIPAFIKMAVTDPKFVPGVLFDWMEENGAESLPHYDIRLDSSPAEALGYLIENLDSPGYLYVLQDSLSQVFNIDLKSVSATVEVPWTDNTIDFYLGRPLALELNDSGDLHIVLYHYKNATIHTVYYEWLGWDFGETEIVFKKRVDVLSDQILNTRLYDWLTLFYWLYQADFLIAHFEHYLSIRIQRSLRQITEISQEQIEEESFKVTRAFINYYGDQLEVNLNQTGQWVTRNGSTFGDALEALSQELYFEMSAAGDLDDWSEDLIYEFAIYYS